MDTTGNKIAVGLYTLMSALGQPISVSMIDNNDRIDEEMDRRREIVYIFASHD